MSERPAVAPMLAMAERAEALGFSSVWVGDSLTARPRHEPLTLLAAVAARTRRVALGTAVLLPALRHPLVLAHAVATVDRVSEGRLILGVGIAGDTPATRKEFAAAGVPFHQRAGRCIETLEICRALWRGDSVSVKGRYWTLDGRRRRPDAAPRGRPADLVGWRRPDGASRGGARRTAGSRSIRAFRALPSRAGVGSRRGAREAGRSPHGPHAGPLHDDRAR